MKPDQELEANGMACTNLTPGIKKAISAMNPDEVLKVMNDDPSSRMGVPAWCRLTGHTLIDQQELSDTDTTFFIKKKNS